MRARQVWYAAGGTCATCALGLVLVMVISQRRDEMILVENADEDLNNQFLNAMASGDQGRKFVRGLEDVWFVEQNSGEDKLAESSSIVASRLETVSFPEDMRDNIDFTVNPCQDFFEFACGNWVKENRGNIPKYQSRLAFSWDHAEKAIRHAEVDLLRADDGTAGQFFRSCMDEDRVEKQGARPMEPWFRLIDEVHDMQSLVRVASEFNKHNMDNFFGWFIDTDPRDSSQKAFQLSEGSLSLPDKSYYLEDSDVMKQHRESLVSLVTEFFRMIGREEAEAEAKMILDLETRMAQGSTDRDVARKDHGTPTTWETFEELTPSWPWRTWLKLMASCTAPPDGAMKACTADHTDLMKVGEHGGITLIIRSKDYFPVLEKILKEVPLEALKAEMRWKMIRNSAVYLSSDFIDLMVKMNDDLYGVSQKSPRPRKCYYSTTSNTPWPAAKLYTDKAFHQENREAALEMLEKIRGRFMENLDHEDWMSADDRKAAQEKLRKMFFQVAWPTDKEGKTHWPVETFDMDGHMGPDFFVNYMTVSRFSIQRDLGRILEKPDRREWGGSSSLDVNAFYGPNNNGLWIPAGILQPPFFDATYPEARNFGSIGCVLGHEMSHGFDDNGRQFDARGELHDWWDQETVHNFAERSSCIANLFDGYAVANRHVNGKLTLGEDIADAGGLKFAYEAFITSKERRSYEKRMFFTAFAQVL